MAVLSLFLTVIIPRIFLSSSTMLCDFSKHVSKRIASLIFINLKFIDAYCVIIFVQR
jgi:hypothetical protein